MLPGMDIFRIFKTIFSQAAYLAKKAKRLPVWPGWTFFASFKRISSQAAYLARMDMFFHIASVERQVDFYKYVNHISLGSRYQMMDYQYFGVQGDLLAAGKCYLFCLPSSISRHNTFRYFFVFFSMISSRIFIFLSFIRAVLSFFAHNIFSNFSPFLFLCPCPCPIDGKLLQRLESYRPSQH